MCIGNQNVSNKAKVTLILHTAHSGNDMNMPNIGRYIGPLVLTVEKGVGDGGG